MPHNHRGVNQDLNQNRDFNCETVWKVLKQYFSFRTAQEGRYSLSDYLGASLSSIQSPVSTLVPWECTRISSRATKTNKATTRSQS
ncbi:hypothetical protein DPMN_033393 [Dreissena polymorpha]|uniref:Uncharacterized protein n=1 Tax=Dreissena polymorpha TaxID=45954 RepID=A0A9D4RIT8_DREPO|nr:hypothetical protein DPMN_033393 [Dreissena polymorpha]